MVRPAAAGLSPAIAHERSEGERIRKHPKETCYLWRLTHAPLPSTTHKNPTLNSLIRHTRYSSIENKLTCTERDRSKTKTGETKTEIKKCRKLIGIIKVDRSAKLLQIHTFGMTAKTVWQKRLFNTNEKHAHRLPTDHQVLIIL